ncbi:uncharacterized protein [Ptychodera flava]|uniref:uncharacterized protein isoform X3 n=1 Tax=Ptychodera flava TaxID=63121 RepID=UPI00396A3F50
MEGKSEDREANLKCQTDREANLKCQTDGQRPDSGFTEGAPQNNCETGEDGDNHNAEGQESSHIDKSKPNRDSGIGQDNVLKDGNRRNSVYQVSGVNLAIRRFSRTGIRTRFSVTPKRRNLQYRKPRRNDTESLGRSSDSGSVTTDCSSDEIVDITTTKAVCPADFDCYLDKLYELSIISRRHYDCIRGKAASLYDKVNELTRALIERGGILDLENADLLENYRRLATKDYLPPVKQNLTKIVQDLQVKYVLNHLVQESAISRSAYDAITAEPTMQGKARRLLSELPPTDAVYKTFKDSLKQPYPHLFDLLEEGERFLKSESQTERPCRSWSVVKYVQAKTGKADKILKAHVSIEVVHTDGDSDSDSCNDDKITREIEENIVVKGRLRITSDDNLNKKYSIDIVELKIGCIILLLNVKNKPGLQKFYTDSKSGELDKILHQLLINDEIKKMAKGRQIRVSVTITEDEYKRISNDFDSEHGTSVTVDPDEVSISATECAQDPQPVDVKQTQNAHAQTSVDKSKSTVSVPRSFTGLKPVQSLEVLKSTSDSVHIRWSPPEGTSEHTGYRISCVQTTGKKKIPSVSEVMSPSVQFWKRGGLIRGQYRVSVSVLYGNGTGNGGGEILSFAKYIDVKVGQSKHRRISKIPTKARNRTKLATQSRFVSYVKAEPESVKEDPGFQDEHHDEPADGKTIDPGTCHSCIGNGGERDKDHMDGEKDSAPSISQSQENKGGASNTNGRKLSFRRGSVRRANSIRIQPRRRCYAISGAWAKTRRGPIKPEKDDSCGGTAETSGAAKSDVDVEIEIRDGKDQNISDVQVYQTSLCSRDDDQSEASGASNKPYHAVQRSDSGVFDQPEGEPIDEASEEEGDTYL